ncbi:hypothetical protein [Actinomadura geliboluensis]|uniref:hypothetical protein n=1 Tax=Actinomadura geliboluensis TaxID=882440 RepID=UPI002613A661|nr:hypothetical protein [Actinomadura geliboluensis]
MTGTETVTGRMQHALDVLAERAGAASRVTSGEAAGLSLAQIAAALDSVLDVWDLVGQMLGPVTDRVQDISERELTERPGDSGRPVLEDAVLHLSYGRDGLAAARALLAVGLADVLRVEQGQT